MYDFFSFAVSAERGEEVYIAQMKDIVLLVPMSYTFEKTQVMCRKCPETLDGGWRGGSS